MNRSNCLWPWVNWDSKNGNLICENEKSRPKTQYFQRTGLKLLDNLDSIAGIYLILGTGIREIRENIFLKRAKMNLLDRLEVCGILELSRTVRKENPRKRGRNTRASFVA